MPDAPPPSATGTPGSTDDPAEVRLTPNTCWILGAGASLDAIGLPDALGTRRTCVPLTLDLMASPGARLLEQLDRLHRARPLAFADEPRRMLEARLGPLIDAIRGLASSGAAGERETALEVLRGMVSHIARTILRAEAGARIPDLGAGFFYQATNYLWLASNGYRMPRWSMLTLNYDLLLDRAFREISEYDLTPSQYDLWCGFVDELFAGREPAVPERGIYLKLHGTLDAFECLEPSCARFRMPFRMHQPTPWQVLSRASRDGPGDDSRRALRELGERDAWVDMLAFGERRCPACNGVAHELVLPPGVNQSTLESAYHQAVFRQARRALERADTWVVLGYSCPAYDQEILALLRDGVAQQAYDDGPARSVWVLSPDGEQVASRLAEAIGRPVGFRHAGFTDLVEGALRHEGRTRPFTP